MHCHDANLQVQQQYFLKNSLWHKAEVALSGQLDRKKTFPSLIQPLQLAWTIETRKVSKVSLIRGSMTFTFTNSDPVICISHQQSRNNHLGQCWSIFLLPFVPCSLIWPGGQGALSDNVGHPLQGLMCIQRCISADCCYELSVCLKHNGFLEWFTTKPCCQQNYNCYGSLSVQTSTLLCLNIPWG